MCEREETNYIATVAFTLNKGTFILAWITFVTQGLQCVYVYNSDWRPTVVYFSATTWGRHCQCPIIRLQSDRLYTQAQCLFRVSQIAGLTESDGVRSSQGAKKASPDLILVANAKLRDAKLPRLGSEGDLRSRNAWRAAQRNCREISHSGGGVLVAEGGIRDWSIDKRGADWWNSRIIVLARLAYQINLARFLAPNCFSKAWLKN